MIYNNMTLINGLLINKDSHTVGPNIVASFFLHYLKTKLEITSVEYGM